MALKWFDGAEIWGAGGYLTRAYASGSASSDAANRRVSPGTSAYSMNGQSLQTPSLGEQNTWIVGFGLQLVNINFEWRLLDAGAEQLRLEAQDNGNSTFEIKVMRGATEIDRTSESFAINTWHYFELKATVRTGTNGAFELRHNETQVLTGSSLNLAETGSDGCDAHSFGHNSGGQQLRMDDIYICDDQGSYNNDFRGDSVVVGILPSAEGFQNDLAPSTGSDNSALVDDPAASASEADYVSSDTNGHVDLYEYDDLPATGLGTIFGVRVVVDAAMETVGSRTLRAKFRSGGSTANGGDFVVDGTSVLSNSVILEQDPVAAGAWTKTNIDNGEFGLEVVS